MKENEFQISATVSSLSTYVFPSCLRDRIKDQFKRRGLWKYLLLNLLRALKYWNFRRPHMTNQLKTGGTLRPTIE